MKAYNLNYILLCSIFLSILCIASVSADTFYSNAGGTTSTTGTGQNHLGAAGVYTTVQITSNASFYLTTVENYFYAYNAPSKAFMITVTDRSGDVIGNIVGGNSTFTTVTGTGDWNMTFNGTGGYPYLVNGSTYYLIYSSSSAPGGGYVRWGEASGGGHTWGSIDTITGTPSFPITSYLNVKLWGISAVTQNSLVAPASGALLNNNNVTFNSTYSGISTNAVNSTLYLYTQAGALIGTNFTNSLTANKTNFTVNGLADGTYNWNVKTCDTSGSCLFASSNSSFQVDTTAPTISLTSPAGLYNIFYPGLKLNVNWNYTDLNIGSCWIAYNNVNTSVTCVSNSSTITAANGVTSLVLYGNDSAGNVRAVSTSWSYLFAENNRTYNSTTYETALESYALNSTFNASAWSNVNVSLYWNGTSYATTQSTDSAGNLIYTLNSFSIPSASLQLNYTVNWNISLQNASNTYNFLSYNSYQLINPSGNITVVPACSAGFSAALNFTIQDENNFTSLNSSVNYNVYYTVGSQTNYKLAYGSLTNINTFYICVNSSSPTFNIISSDIQYTAPGYVQRNYYLFQNTRLSNATTNTTIYLIPSSQGQPFNMIAQDVSLSPYVGYYMELLRWYPDKNAYGAVDMAQTDSSGQGVMFVRLNDVSYRVGLYATDGTLIKLGNSTQFTCASAPCSYNLLVTSAQSFAQVAGIQQNLSYDNATKRFNFIFNDPSQTTSLMNLTVYSMGALGNTVYCSSSIAATSGLLSCDMSAAPAGTYQAIIYRSASPPAPIGNLFQNIGNLATATIDKTVILLVQSMLAALFTLVGAFVSPLLGIFFGVVSAVVLFIFGGVSWWIVALTMAIAFTAYHIIKRIS